MTQHVGDVAGLDLARYIRPGDTVAWGQACAEPLTLTEALAGQRKQLGGVRCFTGISSSSALRPEHCDYLSFVSYTGAGANRALVQAGALDILAAHYSDLPGILRPDVVFLSLPPAGPTADSGSGLGLTTWPPSSARPGSSSPRSMTRYPTCAAIVASARTR